MQYWYKLLNDWIIVEKKHGLSIPYIIGSLSTIDSDMERDTVMSLFEKIISSDNERIIKLQRCPDINEYILTFSNENIDGSNFSCNLNGKITFVAALDTHHLGKNIEQVAQRLSDRYSEYIDAGRYSRGHLLDWTPYTENEKLFIRESLKDMYSL